MRVLSIFLLLLSLNLHAKPTSSDAFVFAQTACFGTCPSFQVIVFSDGTVIFDGESNVDAVGVYKLPENKELFTNLIKLADQYSFSEFKDSYGWSESEEERTCKELWTDSPSTIIKLQYANNHKTVHHYHGCHGFEREQDLKQLEKEIRELLGVNFYIGT
jgi:hypothetical protein